MTVSDLVRRLKVGQLWGTLAIMAGLISAAFALGYKTSSVVGQIELDRLRQSAEELEKYRRKDRFLSLFLRYEQDDRNAATRDALDDHVTKFISESEKSGEFVKFGKGQALQTTVIFWDGSSWTIPPDFRAATLP